MHNGSPLGPRVRGGAGLREHRLMDGTTILEADRGGRAAAAAVKLPFRVSIRTVDGTPSFRVGIGTLNLLVPTGVLAWSDLADTAQYVILDVSTDGNQVTAAAVDTQADSPAPPACLLGAAPTSFKIALAYVGPSDAPFVEQIVKGNLIAQRTFCHQTLRDPIPAGGVPWVNWWTWAVGEKLNPELVEI